MLIAVLPTVADDERRDEFTQACGQALSGTAGAISALYGEMRLIRFDGKRSQRMNGRPAGITGGHSTPWLDGVDRHLTNY